MMTSMFSTLKEFQASLKLLLITSRSDTGSARRCAGFLLGLWNGYFFRPDLQELISLDEELQHAMLVVITFLFHNAKQLDCYVNENSLLPVIEQWGHTHATADWPGLNRQKRKQY